MNPIAFSIWGYDIRWYSIFILAAVIASAIAIERETDRFGIRPDFVFNMLFWAFICGVIGARLYYVLFNFQLFASDSMTILEIWNGGLAIHGGLIAGLLFIIGYTKKYNVRTIRILDMVSVPLLLGQAIGRWGNFFNQEAHGAATTVQILKSFGLPKFIIDGMTIDGVVYTPTFLIESILCLIAFILICFIRRGKYTKVGVPFACYLISYGLIRFFIEISRTDALMIGGFKVAQIVSVIMVIVGIGILMYDSRKGKFEDLYNDRSNIDEIKY